MDGVVNGETLMTGASVIADYVGQRREAKSVEQAAAAQAEAERKKGVAEYATATKQAREEARRGRALMSDAKAAMAGGGGTTHAPESIQVLSDIGGVTEFNVLSAMFEGKSKKQAADYQSQLTRWQGGQEADSIRRKSLGTLISGIQDTTKSYKKWKRASQAAKTKPWRNPDTGQVSRYDYESGRWR